MRYAPLQAHFARRLRPAGRRRLYARSSVSSVP
jgi:hypothetical protein